MPFSTHCSQLQFCKALNRDINFAVADEKIIARHQRRRLRSEVRENQSAQFFDGIGGQADRFFFQLAVRRLAGNLPAAAVAVVQPAVIAAAHAVFLDIAET